MPRQNINRPRRRRSGLKAAAPKPIKLVTPKLDVSGLTAAYEWYPVDPRTAMRLAFEWYNQNLTVLLCGDPLDETRQKSYDRAIKAKNIGDSTDYPEERIHSWTTALHLYEKTWANRNLPKVADAAKLTVVSPRVTAVMTVLDTLNKAFGNQVTFGMTFGNEREFAGTEILIPASELTNLIPQTPLRIALAEAATVAKVLSVVSDEEGNQQLDGAKFMETLPQLLTGVAEWASGDRTLASKPVGRAVRTAPVTTPGTTAPRAPRTPSTTPRAKDSMSITVVNAAALPRKSGNGKKALDAVIASSTVSDLKKNLQAAGVHPGMAGWAIKTAVECGAVTVA